MRCIYLGKGYHAYWSFFKLLFLAKNIDLSMLCPTFFRGGKGGIWGSCGGLSLPLGRIWTVLAGVARRSPWPVVVEVLQGSSTAEDNTRRPCLA